MLIGIITGIVLCIATSIITPIINKIVKICVLDRWFKDAPEPKPKPQKWVIIHRKGINGLKKAATKAFERKRKYINRMHQRYRIVNKLERLNVIN